MKKLLRNIKSRVELWWKCNQAPRARVLAASIHRALNPSDSAGSLGKINMDTPRTGGGIFDEEHANDAEEQLDAVYNELNFGHGTPLSWMSEMKPGIVARVAAHLVVLWDGTAVGLITKFRNWY